MVIIRSKFDCDPIELHLKFDVIVATSVTTVGSRNLVKFQSDHDQNLTRLWLLTIVIWSESDCNLMVESR